MPISTKDRYSFLGKSDLLQRTHAYFGGILRHVQCPTITADHVHAFFQPAPAQNVARMGLMDLPICRAFSAALLWGTLPRPRKLSLG
jgi:hypothetical protein